MDRASGFEKQNVKMEHVESPPPQNNYMITSPLQIVPSTPTYSNQFQPIIIQTQTVTQPSGNLCLVSNSNQSIQASSLMITERNSFSPSSNTSNGEADRGKQLNETLTQIPSYSSYPSGELGKIVRPASPTQQCRIQEGDKNHIGHILMETDVRDSMAISNVCSLSAKTLYLSNSGAVISTVDIPYYWCNFCPFKTEQKLILLDHLMSHRFWCKWCRFQAYTRAEVVRHCMEKHPKHSVDNLKFCVLLPDFLHSKMDSEKVCNAENSNVRQNVTNIEHDEPHVSIKNITPKDGEKNVDVSKPATEANMLGIVCGNVADRMEKKDKEKSTGRYTQEETKSSQTKDNRKSSETVSQKSSTVAKEKETVKKNTPSVCFECCTCHFRTFHKEYVESHQAEVNHMETDKTTKKKTFVLKIVNSIEKDKVQMSDKQWSIDHGTTRRSKRRAKPDLCMSDNTDEDFDNDDDRDEDYDPEVVDGKKKGSVYKRKKLTRSSKAGAKQKNSKVSDVDIEIDTAAEPTADTEVTSFSPSCLNTENSNRSFKVSPKKIVSRNIYNNCIVKDPFISYSKLEPTETRVIKKETNLDPVSSVGSNTYQSAANGYVGQPNHTMAATSEVAVTIPTSYPTANTNSVNTASTSQPIILGVTIHTTPLSQVKTTNPLQEISARNAMFINKDATKTPKVAGSPASSTVSVPGPQTSSSKSSTCEKSAPQASGGSSKVVKKGVFKCAHCRVVADRVLQIRMHILDKHKDNPLYCLDMEAADGLTPRYLLICPFKQCKFNTKSRDSFFSHLENCEHGVKLTEEEKKFKNANLKFVKTTFLKLVKIAK